MTKKFFKRKVDFLTLNQIIQITNCKNDNFKSEDLEKKIYQVATLEKATKEDISFINSASYLPVLKQSKAGFCFIEEKYLSILPKTMIGLVHNNPYFAYYLILRQFYEGENQVKKEFIDKTAIIEKSAQIGKNCHIASGVYIGKNVIIKDNCFIGNNCVIEDNCILGNNCIVKPLSVISYAIIGNRVIIHNGVKIGQDGFGFVHHKGINHKILQIGIVQIGDDVEIGANSCIDRGAINNTKIGNDVKIDNLVQIAHNVQIGDGTVIAGCAAVAGSAIIGKFCQIGGGANVAGHIKVGDGAKIAGGSGVAKSVEPMQAVGGLPAVPIKDWHRITIKLLQIIRSKK